MIEIPLVQLVFLLYLVAAIIVKRLFVGMKLEAR